MTSTHAEFMAERKAAEIARYAKMTIADLEYWIGRIEDERSEPLYEIMVSSYQNEKSADDLFRYRRELARRLRMSADEVLTPPASLSQATDFFCAQLVSRSERVTPIAAE